MLGISLLPQIPMRAEKSHRAEMVSQILFGETYEVIEYSEGWMHVKTDFDSYKGWIDARQFTNYTGNRQESMTIKDKMITVADENNNEFIISAGSIITVPDKNGRFNVNGHNFTVKGTFGTTSGTILETAKKFIGCPYLWGGKTFMGFDCSGFVQTVFKLCDINLPRDASQQVNIGETLSIVQEAKGGELAFFGDEENITHVGILMDSENIIHCSGKVKVERIDNNGVFNGNEYTHLLRTIKVINSFINI